MSLEEVIARIRPTSDLSHSDRSRFIPVNCSARAYEKHDPSEVGSDPGGGRREVVIELHMYSDVDVSDSQPHETVLALRPFSPGRFAADDRFDQIASSVPGVRVIHKNAMASIAFEVRRMRQRFTGDGQVRAFHERLQHLSPRELDVLILLMQGKSCKEVAATLGVGFATAAKHRIRVLKKLGVRDPIELTHLLVAVFDNGDDGESSE